MRARIRCLAPELADQIAAGEVVERPASVVKELVENSVDAGARSIEIHVEGGGSVLLRVRDDGHGIASEDLSRALQRHATSKLRSAAELARMRTLGFRGEALPSIASVSRLRLLSRPPEQEQAWELRVEGGRPGTPAPAPGAPGTRVEVRDLFYNLPARRKFLRTDRTEQWHIQELVRRLALGSPGTAFSLQAGDQSVLRLAATEQLGERVGRLLGKAFLEQAVEVEGALPGMRLRGWAGLPERARSQPDRQYFFLDGRALRDRNVNHALRAVYSELLAPGRYPCYVLYLDLEPGRVDVNVHPAKHEVRFREPRAVHDFIAARLQRLLVRSGALFTRPGTALLPARPGAAEVREVLRGYGEFAALPPGVRPAATAPSEAAADPDRASSGPAPATGSAPRVLGLVARGRYLLAAAGEGLLLVDYPAARRLLCLQGLRRAREAGTLCGQPLLLPCSLDAAEPILRLLGEWRVELEQCGLLLQQSGPVGLLVRELPAALRGVEAGAAGAALLRMLEQRGAECDPERRVAALLEALATAASEAPPEPDRFAELLGELGAGQAVPAGRRGVWRRCGARELGGLLKT